MEFRSEYKILAAVVAVIIIIILWNAMQPDMIDKVLADPQQLVGLTFAGYPNTLQINSVGASTATITVNRSGYDVKCVNRSCHQEQVSESYVVNAIMSADMEKKRITLVEPNGTELILFKPHNSGRFFLDFAPRDDDNLGCYHSTADLAIKYGNFECLELQ